LIEARVVEHRRDGTIQRRGIIQASRWVVDIDGMINQLPILEMNGDRAVEVLWKLPLLQDDFESTE
jgi:hypothetical protein